MGVVILTITVLIIVCYFIWWNRWYHLPPAEQFLPFGFRTGNPNITFITTFIVIQAFLMLADVVLLLILYFH